MTNCPWSGRGQGQVANFRISHPLKYFWNVQSYSHQNLCGCRLEVDHISASALVSAPNVANLWLSVDIRLWPNASVNFRRGFWIWHVFWPQPKVESTAAICELSCGFTVHIVHSSTSVVTSTAAAASACETCTDWESPISTTWKFCAKVSVSATNQRGQQTVV